jgi:hypothetical protein
VCHNTCLKIVGPEISAPCTLRQLIRKCGFGSIFCHDEDLRRSEPIKYFSYAVRDVAQLREDSADSNRDGIRAAFCYFFSTTPDCERLHRASGDVSRISPTEERLPCYNLPISAYTFECLSETAARHAESRNPEHKRKVRDARQRSAHDLQAIRRQAFETAKAMGEYQPERSSIRSMDQGYLYRKSRAALPASTFPRQSLIGGFRGYA